MFGGYQPFYGQQPMYVAQPAYRPATFVQQQPARQLGFPVLGAHGMTVVQQAPVQNAPVVVQPSAVIKSASPAKVVVATSAPAVAAPAPAPAPAVSPAMEKAVSPVVKAPVEAAPATPATPTTPSRGGLHPQRSFVRVANKSPAPDKGANKENAAAGEAAEGATAKKGKRASKGGEQDGALPRLRGLGNYTIHAVVGEGGCALVQLATHEPTRMTVAVKTFEKTAATANGRHVASWQEVQQEMRILRKLGGNGSHPNVVSMIEVFQTAQDTHIVMEYLPRGDLYHHAVVNGLPSVHEVRRMFVQMIGAVQYVHSQGILHRDLKAENFLLDDNLNIRLSDFGIAETMTPGKQLTSVFLSLPYCAPEMLRYRKYTGFGVDVWALGILLYFLLTGRFPFRSPEERKLYMEIESGVFDIPARVPAEAQDLIRSMLRVKPHERITMDGIAAHPWVQASNTPPPTAIPVSADDIDKDIVSEMERKGLGKAEDIINDIKGLSFNDVHGSYTLMKKKKAARRQLRKEQKAKRKEGATAAN